MFYWKKVQFYLSCSSGDFKKKKKRKNRDKKSILLIIKVDVETCTVGFYF